MHFCLIRFLVFIYHSKAYWWWHDSAFYCLLLVPQRKFSLIIINNTFTLLFILIANGYHFKTTTRNSFFGPFCLTMLQNGFSSWRKCLNCFIHISFLKYYSNNLNLWFTAVNQLIRYVFGPKLNKMTFLFCFQHFISILNLNWNI